MMTRIIVVTGGVYSSLGKGIIASSLGCILKHGDFKISMLKLDPYLNVDPGLLSPFQHGEIFITEDGKKTDLDLGHYERFTCSNLTGESTTTSGNIYNELFVDEIHKKFNGATVQVVPHFTNKVIEKIDNLIKKQKNPDFLIIEIGGTIGDIEGLPFIEALRIYNAKNNNVLFVHSSPLFQLEANGELKTKPTQHSIKNIRNLGINPHILILRYRDYISKEEKAKLAWTCDVKSEDVFISKDCKNLYEVPKILFDQGIHISIMKYFNIKKYKFDMTDWNTFLKSIYKPKNRTVKICICGKYTGLNDAYLSLIESLKIASYKTNVNVEIDLISGESLNTKNYNSILGLYDGYIVTDATEDKSIDHLQLVAKYCYEENKPYLGIKQGLKVMLEYLSTTKQECKTLRIKDDITKLHALLGNQKVYIRNNNSLAYKIYKENQITERHWNQWFVNEQLIKCIKDSVLVSGINSKNQIEIVEAKNKKFFLGVLFHPEFSSKPNWPHPLFISFIKML